MPRLPKEVPLSKSADEDRINASLVFACTNCWESHAWGFVAYNDNGRIYQIRRCFGEHCYLTIGEGEAKGKWVTQQEAHEKWCEYVGDFE